MVTSLRSTQELPMSCNALCRIPCKGASRPAAGAAGAGSAAGAAAGDACLPSPFTRAGATHGDDSGLRESSG
eukprot:5814994-Lingulodinium_polyedra.AAC.1